MHFFFINSALVELGCEKKTVPVHIEGGNFTQLDSATNTWLILQAHIISEQTAFQNKKWPNKT